MTHDAVENPEVMSSREAWDTFVGLRADEPNRVAKLAPRSTQRETFRMPLAAAGITKADVLAFWGAQDFDLDIEERQGNCTGCFLKSEGDLARVLAEPETDAAWWVRMAERYPNFGGKRFPGYAQLRREAPVRLAIESAFRGGAYL